ncbi:MAG: bifunctional enoyl-CoA hydratase/phosphate acetyltransferase [Defluviitaleaceae bacterium]|nr:bifunctional enoyl-CoA hydratase/phosphate acetyltransferase [Defluviitaleaceae bacterium]
MVFFHSHVRIAKEGGDPINILSDLYEKASLSASQSVCIACADDANVLTAVQSARDIAKFILVGDINNIRKVADSSKIDISGCVIVDEPDPASACKIGVQFVSSGKAAALMKGKVDTSIIMKAVLDKEAGMRTVRKLSHVAVFELPTYHKLLFVTDAAINIAPDISVKKEIIHNAVEATLALGITRPKVALLAAKEKADPKMPVTMDIVELVANHKAAQSPLDKKFVMDGPLALDNAICKESCEIKGIDSLIGGDADILVCPDIEAGNILYKALGFLAKAKVGGVVLGAKRPIILTSRADSAESKLISIALGILS